MLGIFGFNKNKYREIEPVKRIRGNIEVSADKSLSHRSIIFTSLARGKSVIKNFLYAQDCINTLKVFKKLGVDITQKKDGTLVVQGEGPHGLKRPRGKKLYFGNSATGMRLTAGILSAQDFSTVLKGDQSLMERPMRRITVPLTRMGAHISARNGNKPPLRIEPCDSIKGIEYTSPVSSAQVKSSILLAGLYAGDNTRVTEPFKSRDHTERLMKYFDVPLKVDGNTVELEGGNTWEGKPVSIPGDFSSAAFFITAALLVPDSELKIDNVNLNPTRTGFLNILEKMGADIEIEDKKTVCNELVGNILIKYGELEGIKLGPEDVPSVIDEIPLIALLATRAKGKTIMDGLSELRKKETDRLHAITTQLNKLGQAVIEQRDSLIVEGKKSPIKGEQVQSFKDHRIAMMLAVAGLIGSGKVKIDDVNCIKTSFPEFFNLMEEISEQ
ncbi:MAG: 3-phosphoshikimate 1-carboxyvinyltransferase [Elusimicrobiota bacterium]